MLLQIIVKISDENGHFVYFSLPWGA